MKNNIPHKRYFPPDEAWNINDYHYVYKRNRHWNGKKYWLNVFNRKLRRFLKKLTKDEL